VNTATAIIGFVIFLASCDGISSNSGSRVDGVPVNSGPATGTARGPLRILSENPGYFTDGSGRAVYLTGSHHWDNLVDRDAKGSFDYVAYLDFLIRHNHNFVRLWTAESAAPKPRLPNRDRHPLPYQRTGPGTALDGNPKFDLSKFEPAYFNRLRSRVLDAQERGIYVMVMLFQGFSIHNKGGGRLNPWPGHPFNVQNNINGIDGDTNGNGEGEEVHTLESPAITKIQESYVRRVVDTLNDLDNVLYEIANESHRASAQWQYHMIRLIQNYERSKPKQHPVVMTFMWNRAGDHGNDDNATLLAAPADAISPGRGLNAEYQNDPPAADGAKIIISDTDHLWGVGGDEEWVWKSFLRGLNPIFMDPIEDPKWDSARKAMGQTLRLAKTIDLARMVPRTDLASTGYCMANPATEYLVYLPAGSHWLESGIQSWMGETRFIRRFSHHAEKLRPLVKLSVEVRLSETAKPMQVTWFNPATDEFIPAGQVGGKGETKFTAPFTGHAVLHLKNSKP
jgi:Family of unknown function (DUF6298)